jgi:hypothetical protein
VGLARGHRPGIVLVDAGYGNNTNFLKTLEKKKLKYLGGLAKNRKVMIQSLKGIEREVRLDEYAESLSKEDFEKVILNLDQPKTVWVATFVARLSRARRRKNFCDRNECRCF